MTKQMLRTSLVLLCWASLGVTACNGNRDRQDKERAAILTRQPFAPLTDSLDHHEGNDRAGLFFRRAELLSQNDQHELAAEDYSDSWGLKPDQTTGLHYASSLAVTGQLGKAIRILQECRNKFPENPVFPNMLAELYAQSNRLLDAIAVYDDILRTDSLNSDAWYEKGLLLEKKRRYCFSHPIPEESFYIATLEYLWARNGALVCGKGRPGSTAYL